MTSDQLQKLCCKCHKNLRYAPSVAYCKDCWQKYCQEYYVKHIDAIKTRSKKRRGIRKQKMRDRKLELIQSKGQQCERCGYNKNLAALGFHHPNGRENPVKRGRSNLHPRENPQSGKFDITKVVLLCLNCHAEIEHPELDMEKLKK